MKKLLILTSLMFFSACSFNKVKNEDTSLDESQQYGSTEIGLKDDVVYIQTQKDLQGYYNWIKDYNDNLEIKLKSVDLNQKTCMNKSVPGLNELIATRMLPTESVVKNHQGKLGAISKTELEKSLDTERKFKKEGSILLETAYEQTKKCQKERDDLVSKLEKKQTNEMIKSLGPKRGIAQISEDQPQEPEYIPEEEQVQEPVEQQEPEYPLPTEEPITQENDY